MATDPGGEADALESRVIEANALALGVSLDELMENAGRAVAEEAARRLPSPGARVLVVAGTGNNGGDGSAAAFYLAQWGHRPEVWLLRAPSEITGASARRRWERLQQRVPTHIGLPSEEDLAQATLVIDAALGAGQSGELRSPYREAVDRIVHAHRPTLAVDVPTGLGAAHALRPDWTVTLTVPKRGMSPENSGEVVVRDIGIPSAAWQSTGPGEFLRYPDPRGRSERGRSGRVLVVGGGPFSGAPALAAIAALRAGAERATVVTPEPAASAVRALSPDLIVHAVGASAFAEGDAPAVERVARETRVDAIILGMGAGRDPGTVALFRSLLGSWRGSYPLLVDADALAALSASPGGAARTIATPNAGEYERVFGPDPAASAVDRLANAGHRARDWGVTLLVKGHEDLISDGRTSVRNPHHHPAATVGGVGDVLAGVVGGLLAQGLSAIGAARLGAYWVGLAGSLAAEQRDYSLLATDVLEALSPALVGGLAAVRTPG